MRLKVRFCNQFFSKCTRKSLANFGLKHLAHSHAIGSPLGPTLAHAFLAYFEKSWQQNCPSDFKPHYYRRYVDIFALFASPEHLEAFRNSLNG